MQPHEDDVLMCVADVLMCVTAPCCEWSSRYWVLAVGKYLLYLNWHFLSAAVVA